MSFLALEILLCLVFRHMWGVDAATTDVSQTAEVNFTSNISSSSILCGNSTSCAGHGCDDLHSIPEGDQRCHAAWKHCETQGFLNYHAIYHCCPAFLVWPMFFLLAMFLMSILGDIAESHFCPSLASLSEHFHLSPAVAGPTLLAFGNGSPDIATSLIGLVANDGSQDLGLNSPLGGGLFVISVVVAAIMLVSPVHIERWPFFRDTGFYALAVILLGCVISDGVVHIAEALALLLLYAIYVIIVIFSDSCVMEQVTPEDWDALDQHFLTLIAGTTDTEAHGQRQGTDAKHCHFAGFEDEQGEELVPCRSLSINGSTSPKLGSGDLACPRRVSLGGWSCASTASACSSHQLFSSFAASNSSDSLLLRALHSDTLPEVAQTALYKYFKFRYKLVAKRGTVHRSQRPCNTPTSERQYQHVDLVAMTWISAIKQFLVEDLDWGSQQGWRKLLFALQLPFRVALFLTVPRSTNDPDEWRKLWAVTFPTASPLLLLVASGDATVETFTFVMLTGMLCSLAMYHVTHVARPPSWAAAFALVGFVMSIAWMFLMVREILGLLSALGALLHVSQPLLAVTILAWGNCIGDLVADVAMARKGHATTAVCAAFGSPLLTLLFGLGSAFCWQALLHFPAFHLGQVREDVAFCLFSLLLFLLTSLIIVPMSRFQPSRLFGVLLLLLYCSFCACMMGYEQGVIRFNWLPFPDSYCAAPASVSCRSNNLLP